MKSREAKTASELIEQFVAEGRSEDVFNADTARVYRNELLHAERFSGVPVHEMTIAQIEAYLNRPSAKSPPGAPVKLDRGTVWNSYMRIKHFLQWALNEVEISWDVIQHMEGKPYPYPERKMPTYRVKDVGVIFKAMAERSARPWIAARNTQMLYFAYYMGLRVSSIVSIKLDEVNLTSGNYRAFFKLKGEYNETIPAFLLPELKYYVDRFRSRIFIKNPDQGFLFPSNRGGRITPEHFSNIVSRVVKMSGVERHRYFGPHGFRGTGITHAHIVDGIPLTTVSKRIGVHAWLATTGRYLNPNEDDEKNNTNPYPHQGPNLHTIRKYVRDYDKPHKPDAD